MSEDENLDIEKVLENLKERDKQFKAFLAGYEKCQSDTLEHKTFEDAGDFIKHTYQSFDDFMKEKEGEERPDSE